MDGELNAHEARVLGVLVEKDFTTPDQYPLSLNAAMSGSNQKSNRDPVLHFSEAEVHVALQGLQQKHLAGGTQPMGSRVEKFHHNAAAHLGLDERELAVLAELLLRGPQIPGELRARASRMRDLPSLEALSQVLARLMEKGYVVRLPPRAGSRSERYAQRLAPTLHPDGEPEPAASPEPAKPTEPAPAVPRLATSSSAPRPALEDRVRRLEGEVTELRRLLQRLAESLGERLES